MLTVKIFYTNGSVNEVYVPYPRDPQKDDSFNFFFMLSISTLVDEIKVYGGGCELSSENFGWNCNKWNYQEKLNGIYRCKST